MVSSSMHERPVPVPHVTTPGARAPPARGRQRCDDACAEERDLLVRVATGDQVAFGDLIDRLGGRVYGVALRVIHDPSQAEEISQEVLLEVWRKAARFDPDRGSAAGWILTMAHHRAVDRTRREQAGRDRTRAAGVRDHRPAFDGVFEQVVLRGEHTEVRAPSPA